MRVDRARELIGRFGGEEDFLTPRATPLYVYDTEVLKQNVTEARAAARYHFPHSDVRLHFAIKANNEPGVLDILRPMGIGIDAVSIEEVERALEIGFDAGDIMLAGVGKTANDIYRAVCAGVGMINIESVEEIALIGSIGERMRKVIPVAIRLNPDIDPHTHAYITTGLNENKFGIPASCIPRTMKLLKECVWLDVKGLHFHIGSQITDTGVFGRLGERASEYVHSFISAGFDITSLDLGGGLGIDYADPDGTPVADYDGWFGNISRGLKIPEGIVLHFEPGRSLVAQSGSLLTSIVRIKKGATKKFMVLDAGFNALVRPAFYHALHRIDNLSALVRGRVDVSPEIYDVVGPLCESSDVFATGIEMCDARPGDLIAIRSAGAYGSSMASAYNLRALNPSVFY